MLRCVSYDSVLFQVVMATSGRVGCLEYGDVSFTNFGGHVPISILEGRIDARKWPRPNPNIHSNQNPFPCRQMAILSPEEPESAKYWLGSKLEMAFDASAFFCKGHGGDMFAYIDVPKQRNSDEDCWSMHWWLVWNIYIYIILARACLYATALSLPFLPCLWTVCCTSSWRKQPAVWHKIRHTQYQWYLSK